LARHHRISLHDVRRRGQAGPSHHSFRLYASCEIVACDTSYERQHNARRAYLRRGFDCGVLFVLSVPALSHALELPAADSSINYSVRNNSRVQSEGETVKAQLGPDAA
jgi:hypothetical protein